MREDLLRLSKIEQEIILNFRKADKVAKCAVLRFLGMDREQDKVKFCIIKKEEFS